MTYPISDITRRVVYSGSLGTGPYPFTFEILEEGDIGVYKNQTLLTLSADYTVTINPDGTGEVDLVSAAASTDTVAIFGDKGIQRQTDFTTGGDLFANSLNDELDAQTIFAQQNAEAIVRAIRAPQFDPTNLDMTLPSASDRADTVLTFDNNGEPQATSSSDFVAGLSGSILGANYVTNTAVGDGSTVNFTVSVAPGAKGNIQIYIDGVYQNKSSFSISGTTITFSEAPPLNASVEFIIGYSIGSTTGDASGVDFTQQGTGAVTTTVAQKLWETVSVKDFGAVGDGVTDDTAAIQAAIDYLSPLGGTLHIPKGSYIVSDANADDACLVVTAPIQFLGDGAFYTSIQPAAGVAGTVNTILVNPNTGFDQTLMSFKNLSLGNLSNGTRQGNHGIYCLTLNAGQNLPKLAVENCAIQQGGGYAIYHLNDPVANINGGMYGCYIKDNNLKGGIKFENSGDSLVVSNNILTGTGTGVDAALVTGASLLSILDNNITTTNSAIIIRSGMRVHILRNNIEHYTTGSNNNSVIDIVSSGSTYVSGTIQQNLVSAFGSTDASKLIDIDEARGTLIQDNTFLAGVAGITAIDISNTCSSLRVGANSYNAAIATKVNDLGIGTMGVKKSISLLNSWVEQTTADTPTFHKTLSGDVVIEGCIKDGTTTSGTKLFSLPEGFRPPAGSVKRFNAYSIGGGGAEFGQFLIDEAGDVFIQDGGNIQFILNGAIFMADNAADSVSPE